MQLFAHLLYFFCLIISGSIYQSCVPSQFIVTSFLHMSMYAFVMLCPIGCTIGLKTYKSKADWNQYNYMYSNNDLF